MHPDYSDMDDYRRDHTWYYVYLNAEDKICVIEATPDDLRDYHEHRFYADSESQRESFKTREEARKFVNKTFKRSVIADDALTPNHSHFLLNEDE